MGLKNVFRILLAVVLALSGVTVAAAPSHGAAQQYNPCAKLSAGEVKFPSHGAKRVTFATATDYGVAAVLITGCVKVGGGKYVQEWQDTGFGGLNGFAPPGEMWENTWYSPTGSFSVTEALGRSNPGTALKYYTIQRNSKWGGERGPTYNQYFEGPGGPSDEDLWKYMNQGFYEQAAVINWNRLPDMKTVQGASFAIFFHAGNVPSAGCISTHLSTVTQMLRTAVPGDRFIMGRVADVFKPAAPAPQPKPKPKPAPEPEKKQQKETKPKPVAKKTPKQVEQPSTPSPVATAVVEQEPVKKPSPNPVKAEEDKGQKKEEEKESTPSPTPTPEKTQEETATPTPTPVENSPTAHPVASAQQADVEAERAAWKKTVDIVAAWLLVGIILTGVGALIHNGVTRKKTPAKK